MCINVRTLNIKRHLSSNCFLLLRQSLGIKDDSVLWDLRKFKRPTLEQQTQVGKVVTDSVGGGFRNDLLLT